jgi:DNA-binding NarL/FixJ family response regulator
MLDTRARVLLVSDDLLSREGLATSLAKEPAIQVVGQAASGEDIAAEARRLGARVIVWDSGRDFSAQLDRLRELGPLPADLAMIAGEERGATEAYNAGARAFFLRDRDTAALPASIALLERGMVVLDGAIAGSLFAPRQPPRESPLTPRELEVLSAVSEGLSNKAIAAQLGISENTAKFHVNAILTKLGAETRTEAVVLGARLGLIVL